MKISQISYVSAEIFNFRPKIGKFSSDYRKNHENFTRPEATRPKFSKISKPNFDLRGHKMRHPAHFARKKRKFFTFDTFFAPSAQKGTFRHIAAPLGENFKFSKIFHFDSGTAQIAHAAWSRPGQILPKLDKIWAKFLANLVKKGLEAIILTRFLSFVGKSSLLWLLWPFVIVKSVNITVELYEIPANFR